MSREELFQEIIVVLTEFQWGNYGYDDIDIGLAEYPEYQEWLPELANEILDRVYRD